MPFFLAHWLNQSVEHIPARALNLAEEVGVTRLVLETNSTGVAVKLVLQERVRSSHGPQAEEVKGLLRGFQEIAVQLGDRRMR